MAKEGGSFDFSEQIEDINFTIDDTSKCYTIPDYDYWSSSTLINDEYKLDIEKLIKVIDKKKYNKLGLHGLTINWDGAEISINSKTKTINTTSDLLKAIQDVGTTVDLNGFGGTTVGFNDDGKLRNSKFTSKYNDLSNRIETLQNRLNDIEYGQPGVKYFNVYFDGFDVSNDANDMLVLEGTEISLPTSVEKYDTYGSDLQYEWEFKDWKNNLGTYNPGSKVAIYRDTTFTAEFIQTTLYHVTFKINYGKILGDDGEFLTQYDAYIPYGQTTKLYVEPDEGYDLPTFVDNGTINGYEVTCKQVYEPFECIINCIEEDTSYTYIGYIGDEPEEPEIKDALVQFDGFDWFDGQASITVSEGDEITLPASTSVMRYSDSQNKYELNGWKNNLTNETYTPGESVIIKGDTTFTAQFTAIPIEYLVTLEVTNGKIINGSPSEYLTYGQQATWTIEPDEGFDLPTNNTCGNCTINGNVVTSDKVESSMTCTANCILDTSYTYIGDIDDPFNGHLCVDLGLPSGTKWATMNIGADSIYEYGNYYMYGMSYKTYNSTDTPYSGTENPLDLNRDTANTEWGGDWHMPTQAQIQELIENTTYTWQTNYNGSGINGGLYKASNGHSVFFPACGYYSSGDQSYVGDYGFYWSSSNGDYRTAYYLGFGEDYNSVGYGSRDLGNCIRGVVGNL